VILTFAFGIEAPAGSVIVPNKVAVDNWPNAADENTESMTLRRARQMVRETFNMVDLLEVKQCESN
jgi:hypothetical protein